LRVLDGSQVAAGQLSEVAYFDTIPCSDTAQFSGSWSTYVGFPSGNVVTSDVGNGLFVLTPDWTAITSNNPPGAGAPATSPLCDTGSGGTPTPSPSSSGGGGGGGGSMPGLLFIVLLLSGRLMRSRRQ